MYRCGELVLLENSEFLYFHGNELTNRDIDAESWFGRVSVAHERVAGLPSTPGIMGRAGAGPETSCVQEVASMVVRADSHLKQNYVATIPPTYV